MNHSMIVKEAADYIEEHLDEDLPLDKIAKALNYSKFYLSRVFHEETKCTIYKYIQGHRLTLAAKKLVETDCRDTICSFSWALSYKEFEFFSSHQQSAFELL